MRNLFWFLSLLLFLPSLGAQDAASIKLPPQILTNQGVVTLSDAGYDEDFLIDLIQSKQTHFDTSPEGLAFLAQHGLCEHVVRTMLTRANAHDQHAVVAGPATVQVGVQIAPLAGTTWIHGAGFPVRPPAQPAPYQVVRRRTWLFRHRWYLVQSDVSIPAKAYKLPSQGPVSIPSSPAWYGGQ